MLLSLAAMNISHTIMRLPVKDPVIYFKHGLLYSSSVMSHVDKFETLNMLYGISSD
jgi:hypothetical protein